MTHFFWQVTFSSCGVEENYLDRLVGFSFFPCLWDWNIPHNTEDRKPPVWLTNPGVVGESPWGLARTLLWTQPRARRGCIFSHAFLKYLLHTVAEAATSHACKSPSSEWRMLKRGCSKELGTSSQVLNYPWHSFLTKNPHSSQCLTFSPPATMFSIVQSLVGW